MKDEDNIMRKEATTTNPLGVLEAQHQEVRRLFQQACDTELSDEALQPVATEACTAWSRLARIEEDLLYPRFKTAGVATQETEQALIEHQLAAQLVKRLIAGHPADPAYRAALVVLGENVSRHLEKEEKRLFPLGASLDLGDLAERVRSRQGQEIAAAADTRSADGRIDVGTGEDRNPPLP